VFAESSEEYSGQKTVSGEVWHHAIISRDVGKTWQNVVVAKVPIGEACVADGCSPDFYLGQTSVVADRAGHLVFAYEGPPSDGGRTWSAPVKISDAPAGAAGYVGQNGFAEIYGDYGEAAVTSTGKTFAAWGEGFSYSGPGRTWFNIQS